LLVRHGSTDAVGRRLTGRLPGVSLDQAGRREVAALAEGLSSWPLAAVYSSPLERARETALALAAPHRLEIIERAALNELELGEWSGATLADLDADPGFGRFNHFRAGTRPPGGEHIVEVEARMVTEVLRLRERHPEQLVAVVGHADPLRCVLAFFLGIPLSNSQSLRLSPGTASLLELGREGVCLHFLNDPGTRLFERPQRLGGSTS
jgi:probable phosphoglycerate mutase